MLVGIAGHGAQDVVGLVALDADDGASGQVHELPAHGHLGPELLGHGGTGALIGVVELVAEGRGPQVVGRHHHVRGMGGKELQVGLGEAEQGVGLEALPVGEVADGVKRPVHQGVEVDGKNFHGKGPFH